MIEKFIAIKNIGRFRNCTPHGDVSFRKLTLLHAENGCGKTTLCAIIRSLMSGNADYISERKAIGTSDDAYVNLRLWGSNYTFANNSWSAVYPDLAVFDTAFIHENVYSGDYVDHDQKKNLYRVIVGPQGVNLANQIEELDGLIRKANDDIREKKQLVSRLAPLGTPVEDFLTLQPISEIDKKIDDEKREIAILQRTLDKSSEIQAKEILKKINFPSFPTDFLSILSKQIDDVSIDAEERVQQHIKAHVMGEEGESWLSQGMGYISVDKCPFCGKGIDENELIAAYQSHFNDAYRKLKKDVADLSRSIEQQIGANALISTQQHLSENLTLLEFWRQFDDVSLTSIDFDDLRTKYEKLRNCALHLAQKKQQSPLESVATDADFQTALDEVDSLQSSVDSYNASVDVANTIILEQKEARKRENDISDHEKVLEELKANKSRFEANGVQACEDYQNALVLKSSLEQQKEGAKDQLDQHCSQIIQTYQASINDYLDQFNAGFRITNSRHLYTGGTPSSHYQIEIEGHAIALGDMRTEAGTPCFKTTLSSGDRSALAFAFFLAALEQDPSISDKIVVLDDPFTSQDRFRRTCTQQLITQLASKAQQVIVLSHDPYFLKLLWDGYTLAGIKTIQMCRTGNGTVIAEWDIEAETQSTYIRNYSALLDYYRNRNGVPMDVARSIRPFLEGMLRSHFPGHFAPSEWLGDFISKIRNASTTSGLSHAKPDLAELEAINGYSKKYHHDQNLNADNELIDKDELHGYVKRTLKLVGGCKCNIVSEVEI